MTARADRPAAPVLQPSYHRVGRTRLTPFGAVVLAAVVIGASSPPQGNDRQVMVVVWAALVGLLVVGAVWPIVAVRRLGVTASGPRDATVGDHVAIEVRTTGRASSCHVRALDPTGPWHRTSAPAVGALPRLADRRGVFPAVRLEVRVTAPLGIVSASRARWAVLPVPMEVAPRPLAVAWQPAPAPITGGDAVAAGGLPGVEQVRSVRPYVAGDPAHLVHWPTSARAGSLVVREMEPPTPVGQVVVLDLRDLGADAERAASYALGAARAVLASGGRLVLCTAEPAGPVTGVVRTSVEAGRRIARAVDGIPGTPPEGWAVVEIGR